MFFLLGPPQTPPKFQENSTHQFLKGAPNPQKGGSIREGLWFK